MASTGPGLPKAVNNLTEETLKQFLENQKAQISLDAENLKLKHEELRANTKLAEKSMELQANYLARQPSEGRKSLTRMAYVIGGIILLFFIFIAYCLNLGKEGFIVGFLKNVGYLITTALGYWMGRKEKKDNNKKSEDSIQEVETIS